VASPSRGRRSKPRRRLALPRPPLEVVFLPAATREFRGVPQEDQLLVTTAVEALSQGGGDVRKLREVRRLYRLRAGNWRVIFEADWSARKATVVAIERRGEDTYKRL